MATEVDGGLSHLDSQFDRLSITSEESSSKGVEQEISKHDDNYLRKWGIRLKDIYRLGLRFYKEKEGKAVQFSYEDKHKLVAFTKQVSAGKFNPHNTPPLGVLDVIGRDRRLAWQALGDMTAEDAMAEFVEFLNARCHLFRPFIEAHKADMENRKRLREEEEKKRREEEGRRREEEELKLRGEEDKAREEGTKRQIQEALNRQTLGQFTAYAREQFPDDVQKQEEVVRQLQEQHYHQYMEEVRRAAGEESSRHPPFSDSPQDSETDDPAGSGCGSLMPVASMWTRKDVKEFKESIRKEGGDAVIRVGHGETVTVRVPTNDEGTCLFWEFATDYYDIGFGVYFEWSKSPTNQVSVHVSESEDDDDYVNDDDDDDEYGGGVMVRGGDVECGGSNAANRAALSIIVPVYRRDCQDEVYAGSHAYPGQGVYLLKFDNSYSLWRSKTLYYRVYYTR